jgi:uncharacterized membrane protein YfcA
VTTPTLAHLVAATAAAFVAGAINAIAGGGTNVSFPALVWLGLPPVVANATSAVALWPGSLAGAWGYRAPLRRARPAWLWLIAPSIAGGAIGAWLLLTLPSRAFAAVAPWLVLASTALFAARLLLARKAPAGAEAEPAHVGRRSMAAALLVQLAIAVYGGYFGAGIGILMLATLGLCGIDDLDVANGLKNLLAAAINGTAVIGFAVAGKVEWRIAAVMALGAIAGGWTGAHVAQRLPPRVARWSIVAIGVLMTIVTFRGLR